MARDLLMYFAFAALPIATYLLRGVADASFFLSVLVMSLVVLVWLRIYYQEADQLVDYDENLTFKSLAFVVGGAALILLISSMIMGSVSNSIIHVPIHKLGLQFGGFQLSGFWDDVLFQLVLVAPAEECLKLVVSLSFYLVLRQHATDGFSRMVAIFVPIGFWALLHTYSAYTGSLMWYQVGGAFLGGIVIFAVMKYTKSLLAAILTHFAYNSVVTYSVYYGLAVTVPASFILVLVVLWEGVRNSV